MTKLDPEICRKIKDARRGAKLSQSVVAAEVGCKQSALSMFEQGDGTKLNDAVVEKLAKKFGIELHPAKEAKAVSPSPAVVRVMSGEPATGFCPNPHCPTNHGYEIEGRAFLKPDRAEADPVGGRFCAVCGEVLVKRCPNCGAPVHSGAVCSFCGEPYVALAVRS